MTEEREEHGGDTDQPESDRNAEEQQGPPRPEHDDSEGRDRPPTGRGRDPKSPWLGGG